MKKRILVIEDHADLREITGELLELSGYEVLLAATGTQGLEMALKTLPGMIVTDLRMPQMDGFELAHCLLSDQRTSNIPIILISANFDLFGEASSIHSNIFARLLKPYNEKELLDQIEKGFLSLAGSA